MLEIDTGPCPKVLIAYYSFSGNTQAVAQVLREKTCGVLFGIETHKRYCRQTVMDEAKQELKQRQLPALKHTIPLMSSYDYILVGGPVWWYTVAAPLMAFLQQADFAGRKVAAFCTHAGEAGEYFPNFQSQAGNAVALDGLGLHFSKYKGGNVLDKTLDTWLMELGILPS